VGDDQLAVRRWHRRVAQPAWLAGHLQHQPSSHEAIVGDIAGALAALEGIADVRVTGRFHTAGLGVTVEAA
jgi:hypothetical protein